MTDKLKLKSSHEVVYTVYAADVESIFYCKPDDPDILTVLMKDGKRLYCDEVCPIDSLQEDPVNEELQEAAENYAATGEFLDNGKELIDFQEEKAFMAGAKWQKEKMMKGAVEGEVSTTDYGKTLILRSEQQIKSNFYQFDKVKLVIIKED